MSNPDNIPNDDQDDAYEQSLDNRDLDHMEQMENERDEFLSDAEADADALASCGMGTDEDYGSYGGDE